jgi:tetratricopeptide (TPR) repeat protein
VIAARLEMGRARWLLGYPDRAVEEMQEAMELAFEEPVSIFRAYALTWTGLVHYCRGEFELARDLARKAIAISSDYGFPLWTFVAEMLHGYALRKLNLEPSPRETGVKSAFASAAMTILGLDVGDAVPSSEEFMRAYGEKENNNVNTGLWFAVGLEAHQPVGSPESYCAIVDHLLSSLAKNGEHVWDAELHRHKGTLLLQSDNGSEMEAEGCFRRALEVARAQQAKSLELRAATSLARLQRDRGRNPAARETLAPVYEWFTEGFDTQDLKAAKKLLEELS